MAVVDDVFDTALQRSRSAQAMALAREVDCSVPPRRGAPLGVHRDGGEGRQVNVVVVETPVKRHGLRGIVGHWNLQDTKRSRTV